MTEHVYSELERKVVDLASLLPIVAAAKQQGQHIVTNNGSYDLLHLGHLYGFYFSKHQGDLLIVGVNSDSSVRAYKSADRPINPQHMRVRMVAAIACVDYVFLFDELTPVDWLAKIKPDVHTNGAEYGGDCVEREVVESQGGVVRLIPMVEGFKSTAMIEKIINASNKPS